jgi:hypothetical protein
MVQGGLGVVVQDLDEYLSGQRGYDSMNGVYLPFGVEYERERALPVSGFVTASACI